MPFGLMWSGTDVAVVSKPLLAECADARRPAGISVFRETTHDSSVGDRIQFTAPDKSLAVANRDLAVIESITPNGQMSARLDNKRQIEFNAAEHRHSRFGYVAVSRASHPATIFTDDANRLGRQLSTEVSKTSALEIDQSHSIDQGMSV